MARRRRRPSRVDGTPPTLPDYVQSGTRDPFVIATARPVPGPAVMFPVLISPRSVRALWAFEDRRTWHPDAYRPAASLTKQRHRLTVHTPLNAKARSAIGRLAKARLSAGSTKVATPSGRLSAQIGFSGRSEVLVCVRRHQRRAVAIAKGLRPRKRPKWSTYSKIVCRRR